MINVQSLKHEKGISLLEVLATISLLAMVALGTTANTIFAFQTNKRTQISNFAHNLAMAKIEEFAGIDVSTLDDSDDSVESNILVAGLTLSFTRTTNVTVNADNSRSVAVTVRCNDPKFTGTSSYTSTFALLE